MTCLPLQQELTSSGHYPLW